MSFISKGIYKSMLGAGVIVKNGFNKDTGDAGKANEKVLYKILKKSKNSYFGNKHGFKNIHSIEDYKKKVPITEYKFYEEYIDRMLQGEEGVLVSEKVEYFGHTSGTTGSQKLIPTTRSSRLVGSKYMALLLNRFAFEQFKEKWNYGRGLLIADIVNTTYSEAGKPICSATAGGIRAIKPIISYIYTSPIEVMEIENKETALYLHLLFALKERSLLYISGVFISNIVDLFRILEMNGDNLVKDIKRGRINRNLEISEECRKRLNRYLQPDVERADSLMREFNKGYRGIARRIWPSLVYIATVDGANFSIYDNKLNYYTDDIPVYSPVYAATEATIGINPYVNNIKYVVIPDTAFFEFIPIESSNKINPETVCIDEVSVGSIYEIVITNYAGLYRYRIGDVVKVVGYYGTSPAIEFLYRKNQVLNMVAEKTTEEHLTCAIKNTMRKLNLDLIEYTTVPDNNITPGRYLFYCEFKNPDSISEKVLEATLDNELCAANLAYARARKGRKLGRIKVCLVRKRTFDRIKDMMFEKGVSKNQVKIPRVIVNDEEKMNILLKNVI